MLKRPSPEQTALEIVTLDQLVPADHLLRRIDRALDFSFIHDLTAPFYCADNGRPPLDPTLMFKAFSTTAPWTPRLPSSPTPTRRRWCTIRPSSHLDRQIERFGFDVPARLPVLARRRSQNIKKIALSLWPKPKP